MGLSFKNVSLFRRKYFRRPKMKTSRRGSARDVADISQSTRAALAFNELPIWQSVFWCQCSWLGRDSGPTNLNVLLILPLFVVIFWLPLFFVWPIRNFLCWRKSESFAICVLIAPGIYININFRWVRARRGDIKVAPELPNQYIYVNEFPHFHFDCLPATIRLHIGAPFLLGQKRLDLCKESVLL